MPKTFDEWAEMYARDAYGSRAPLNVYAPCDVCAAWEAAFAAARTEAYSDEEDVEHRRIDPARDEAAIAMFPHIGYDKRRMFRDGWDAAVDAGTEPTRERIAQAFHVASYDYKPHFGPRTEHYRYADIALALFRLAHERCPKCSEPSSSYGEGAPCPHCGTRK